MERAIVTSIEQYEPCIGTQQADVFGVYIHIAVQDGVGFDFLFIKSLCTPAFGHTILFGIFFDCRFTPMFPGIGGHFTPQEYLGILNTQIDAGAAFVAIDILHGGAAMMMEQHNVQSFTLDFVQVQRLHRIAHVKLIEFDSIARLEHLRQLLAQCHLFTAPYKRVFGIVTMTANHGQLVENIPLLFFCDRFLQVIAQHPITVLSLQM